MDEFHIRNKIYEIRSYIASDWPSIEERKALYKELAELERQIREHEEGASGPDEPR